MDTMDPMDASYALSGTAHTPHTTLVAWHRLPVPRCTS